MTQTATTTRPMTQTTTTRTERADAALAQLRFAPAWRMVHHLVAHPLRALTLDSAWSMRVHDWTADRAWPLRARARTRATTSVDALRNVAAAPGSHEEGVPAPDARAEGEIVPQSAITEPDDYSLLPGQHLPHPDGARSLCGRSGPRVRIGRRVTGGTCCLCIRRAAQQWVRQAPAPRLADAVLAVEMEALAARAEALTTALRDVRALVPDLYEYDRLAPIAFAARLARVGIAVDQALAKDA